MRQNVGSQSSAGSDDSFRSLLLKISVLQDLGVAGSRCCRLNWLPRIVCLFHARVIIPHQYCYYVPPALSLVLSYCVDCPEVNGGGEIVYL